MNPALRPSHSPARRMAPRKNIECSQLLQGQDDNVVQVGSDMRAEVCEHRLVDSINYMLSLALGEDAGEPLELREDDTPDTIQ